MKNIKETRNQRNKERNMKRKRRKKQSCWVDTDGSWGPGRGNKSSLQTNWSLSSLRSTLGFRKLIFVLPNISVNIWNVLELFISATCFWWTGQSLEQPDAKEIKEESPCENYKEWLISFTSHSFCHWKHFASSSVGICQ